MSRKVAVVGAYGSGKTLFSTALSHLTGLPRTHGSPMRQPIGGESLSVHSWTPAQLLQMTVNRYTERLLGESQNPDGFVSDGSVVHEWVYAKVRLVAGSYPGTDTTLDDRHCDGRTAAFEETADEIGLLMKRHAEEAYGAFIHVPIEFDLAPDNRPVNENFRHLSDEVLLPALAATGVPLYTVHGSLADRLRQAQKLLDLAPVATIEEAAVLAEEPAQSRK